MSHNTIKEHSFGIQNLEQIQNNTRLPQIGLAQESDKERKIKAIEQLQKDSKRISQSKTVKVDGQNNKSKPSVGGDDNNKRDKRQFPNITHSHSTSNNAIVKRNISLVPIITSDKESNQADSKKQSNFNQLIVPPSKRDKTKNVPVSPALSPGLSSPTLINHRKRKQKGNDELNIKPQSSAYESSGPDINNEDADNNMDTDKIHWKKKIVKMLDNKYYISFMTIITIYALFGDDLRNVAFKQNSDATFYSITTICMIFFFLEIFLSSIAKQDYFLSFYFWLDTLATASLIFDIGWIWDDMTGNETYSSKNAKQATQLARAGRGAQIGTRASRVVRIIRMIRLIRIVKLYKHAQAAMGENENLMNGMSKKRQSTTNIDPKLTTKVGPEINQAQMDEMIPEESKVGKKLSDLTTRRVIMLVLAMMFSVPLFTISTYKDDNNSYSYGLLLIKEFEGNPTGLGFNATFQAYVEEHSTIRTPLVLTNALNLSWSNPNINPDDLRTSEKQIASLNDGEYYAIFDLRANTKLSAGLGICRTFFVCFVLASGALFFSKDANELVIAPIEAMIQKVNRIAKNPLEAAQEEENEAVALERLKENEANKKPGIIKRFKSLFVKKSSKQETPYETAILEQTIIKIGALLALGFGEAGAKIIADNMAHTGDVDPMIPGNKVVAIFGFCDIRQFTDATEILQEEVMLFVNEIAEIVHGIVDRFSGAANKNIGDAFLLVWKYPETDVEYDEEIGNLVPKRSNRVSQIADMTVISFLKIIASIKRSHKLEKYKKRKDLNERMPNYSVKMGFGLHVGWAIEGAIGSDFKIDASYLSPNVNMASRLEAATKQFGVSLLVSGDLFDILTERTQTYMRHIDTVTVKGSSQPMELYTCDVDITDLELQLPESRSLTRQDKKMIRVKARVERNRFRTQALSDQIQVSALFETDEDLIKMRRHYSQEFFETFRIGFYLYLKGEWGIAKKELEQVEIIKDNVDYPTRSLLAFMAETNYFAPPDWNGYRALTEK